MWQSQSFRHVSLRSEVDQNRSDVPYLFPFRGWRDQRLHPNVTIGRVASPNSPPLALVTGRMRPFLAGREKGWRGWAKILMWLEPVLRFTCMSATHTAITCLCTPKVFHDMSHSAQKSIRTGRTYRTFFPSVGGVISVCIRT